MIISLRGTHGSGKSTVVKTILDRYPSERLGTEKKPLGYQLSVPGLDRPLMIVGGYKTACGGCDGIQPYDLIWPRVQEYATIGHVLFEGALVSSSYGNIGRASEVYGNDVVFAFMDTPLEVCIQWIKNRRATRGDVREFNPRNCVSKFKTVLRSIEVAKEIGRRVVMINHRKAVPQILGLLQIK